MGKKCQNIQEQILEYITGALPDRQIEILKAHIYECKACKNYLETLRAGDELFKNFTKSMQPTISKIENNVIQSICSEKLAKSTNTTSICELIIKNRIVKLAAVALIILVMLIGINKFGGTIDMFSPAFAKTIEAIKSEDIIHITTDVWWQGKTGQEENWYFFQSQIEIHKMFDNDVILRDFKDQREYEYNSEDNTITISLLDGEFLSGAPGAQSPTDFLIKWYEQSINVDGVNILYTQGYYNDRRVGIFEFTVQTQTFIESKLIADLETHLPIFCRIKYLSDEGGKECERVSYFNFPDDTEPTEPYNVYDAVVPYNAIVIDRTE